MNKKIYIVAALILGGLIVGASVEHFRMASKIPEAADTAPEIIHHVQKVARENKSDSETEKDKQIAVLNARIIELNSALAKMHAQSSESEEPRKERREKPEREGWQERMERMKKEAPEKYVEMQQRRDEFKTRMEERKLNKQEFLESIATDTMSEPQRENHERLVAVTERVNEIMDKMISGDAENRRELRHEMFESFGELQDLNNNERVYLLEQTAKAVGYEGDEAELFTAHVEDIIENTTMQMPRPPGGGRGGQR